MPEKFQPPRGTRDFLPEEMIIRQKILNKIKSVFESFGFQPLETPAIESWEVLAAKGAGGPEILEETYNFEDKGGRRVGLKYDLTIPLSRVMASNPSLPLPFKRYQIEKVWRYGDITKNRYREFWQADIDTVGTENMLADAEIVACTIVVFTSLGFKNFIVKLNNRKILSALVKSVGVEEEKIMDVFRAIDKLGKIGVENVEKELIDRGILRNTAKKILEFIKIKGKPEVVLKKAEKFVKDIKEGKEGVEELRQLISYLRKMGVEPKFKVDLSLARGLDYYTGPVFEVLVADVVESLAGGGRYDKMIGLFLGRNIPATGISLGIERIIEVMKDRGMIKPQKSMVKVFVVNVNDRVVDDSLKIVQMLRKNGMLVDFDLKGRTLTRQLEYVDSMKIPYALIVGEKELKRKVVKLRDMERRTESEVKISELVKTLKKL
ncbi:MAG: histidine--tRNA ligase [Candidatus Aenigmarchaeota archaeon]|nr:histidine--tRNA ligase [Candidatus Aenigmarchaeota archaeon]